LEYTGNAAEGAVVVESVFILSDITGAFLGFITFVEAQRRLTLRYGNMALNAVGSGVGSAIGSALLPGYGYFLGRLVGSVVAGMYNWRTAKPVLEGA